MAVGFRGILSYKSFVIIVYPTHPKPYNPSLRAAARRNSWWSWLLHCFRKGGAVVGTSNLPSNPIARDPTFSTSSNTFEEHPGFFDPKP